jgi:hypothetical protein
MHDSFLPGLTKARDVADESETPAVLEDQPRFLHPDCAASIVSGNKSQFEAELRYRPMTPQSSGRRRVVGAVSCSGNDKEVRRHEGEFSP